VTRAAVQASKRALRRTWLRVAELPPGSLGPDARARACQERLLELPELTSCRTVALYSACGHEVPLDLAAAALRARGVALVFPRVAGSGLELHRVEPGELVRGAFGLLEPVPGTPAVPVEAVDLFAVPGVAFDRAGNRLGRGGGHYDCLLARARADARRVGLCYGERLLDELPIDEWDIPMCVVVTEGEVVRIRGRERAGAES
jgi:5-formyltetrahydrofolate cyclo-ligase